jgi:preprotein translocase subunit Sss1
MESVQKLNGIGLTLVNILGYIAILSGIIMTFLLLEAVFLG